MRDELEMGACERLDPMNLAELSTRREASQKGPGQLSFGYPAQALLGLLRPYR
jgi:hypothetical protein